MALDCDHIIDNIVLGSYPAILTSKFQQEIKPRIIISMTPEEETYINTAKFPNVKYYRFPISSKMNNEDIIYSSFYRENKTYPKLFKLQLPRDTQGNFLTQFFDENSEKIFVDENNIEELLTKKAIFKTIIGCSKVYLYQGRAGCIWDILQLKFEPKKNYNNLSDNDTCSLSSDEGCSSNNINYVTSNDTNTDKNNDKNNEKNIYNSMSLID